MSSSTVKPSWFLFPDATIFRAQGKDVRRYLHNRLSQDLRLCTPDHPVKAAALNAQGRVEGLYTVFCDAADTFYLVCDGGKRNLLLAALSRFIVADRVSIEDCSSHVVWTHLAATQDDTTRLVTGIETETTFVFSNPRIDAVGTDLLLLCRNSQESVEHLRSLLGEPLSEEAYDVRRFMHGVPAFPDEIHDDMILTEAQTRDAVSFTKGCYVGQEVLERSDALGKVPRLLERIIFAPSPTPLAVGAPILNAAGATIGKIASVRSEKSTGRIFVFAFLRHGKYNYSESVACDGATGTILPPQTIVT